MNEIIMIFIEIHHRSILRIKPQMECYFEVPELAASYPEFSMFKELSACGFYIRHAKGITFDNITLFCEKKDYRTAVVPDDVQGAKFKALKVNSSYPDTLCDRTFPIHKVIFGLYISLRL